MTWIVSVGSRSTISRLAWHRSVSRRYACDLSRRTWITSRTTCSDLAWAFSKWPRSKTPWRCMISKPTRCTKTDLQSESPRRSGTTATTSSNSWRKCSCDRNKCASPSRNSSKNSSHSSSRSLLGISSAKSNNSGWTHLSHNSHPSNCSRRNNSLPRPRKRN